jgi:PAS domain-containing protein
MKESFFAALKRKSLTRTFYWQAAFTVLAFAAIVIIGYFAMNATIRNHLARNSEAVLDLALTKIEAELRGPETTLKTFAELAQQRLLAGTDANAILVLLIDLNRHLLAFDRNEVGYGYLFGIFYTLGPEPIFMHGSGWIPPDDYDAPNRPWHKAAVAGNGNQARSPLYRAMSTGQDVFAITQTIQDESGRLLAVVCIQVPIAPLGKIITETAKEQGGYGMLLDHNLTVLSHPNPDFVGLGVPDPALTFSIFHDNFIKGEDVFERPLTSFVGEESLAFFRKTQDDWYYGMIMPEAPYYNSITNIWYLLIGLGVVAAVFLIYTSARSETKKIRLEKAVLDAEQTLALREAEAKVREADELTHFMIEHAPFIVTLWDKDGQIIDCNQEAVKIFGLSSKKEYMDGFFERGPEYQPNGMNSQELFAKAHLRIFNETEYAQVEWTHNHAVTGEAIPLNVTLVRIKYKDGYAALSYGQDLRERYAAIAKIREADERTQLMTEYAPLVLMLWDKNLQILDCNQEAVRLFGL